MKSVVVTGAGQGIGLATAVHLDAAGWRVVGVDINPDGIAGLRSRHETIATVLGDITERATLEQASAVAEDLGVLGGWVNNAVVGANGRLDEIDSETIQRGLAVNLAAPMVGTQVAVNAFLRSGYPGAIVNVSSVHGRVSYPGFAVYDACKGGLEAFTRYVCVEYGHRGIRCNAIAPGAVVTPAMMADGSATGDERRRSLEVFSPMKALIPTEYYGAIIEFLLSESARFINGHVLAVDGGLLARCYPFEPDPGIPGPVQ